jgi:hypothetical protein
MHKPSVVKELMAAADSFIIQFDRLKYIDAYYAIETYLASNKCLVGGAMAQAILMNKDAAGNLMNIKNRDAFFYEAYAESPYYFGRAMTQAVFDHVSSAALANSRDYSFILDTICFETNVVDHIFTLWINNRAMVKIVALNKYRGHVSLIDIVAPTLRPSLLFSGIVLPLISPEIFLIDLYQRMYNPYPSGGREYRSYTLLIEQEKAAFARTEEQSAAKFDDKVGGSADNRVSLYNPLADNILILSDDILPKEGGGSLSSIKTSITGALLAAIAANVILVGDMAEQGVFSDPERLCRARMQFLTDLAPTAVLAAVSLTLPSDGQSTVQVIEYDLHLPVDIYLKKYIIYLHGADDDKMPLLEFFNSPTYECIATMSTERPGLKRASWPGLLRFRYIDIWGLSIIRGLKKKALAESKGGDECKIKFDGAAERRRKQKDQAVRNAVKSLSFGDASKMQNIEDALAALSVGGARTEQKNEHKHKHDQKHKQFSNNSGGELKFLDDKILAMRRHIVDLRRQMLSAFEDKATLLTVFPIDASHYFGTFIDENVRRKAIIKEKNEGRRFPRFFPAAKDEPDNSKK